MFSVTSICIYTVLLALIGLFYASMVYVPNSKVGIKEKLWSPTGSVKDGIIALNGEAGFEPELLRGGFHFLIPFMYRIHKKDLVFVPQGEMAYVFARDGQSLPPGQTLGTNSKAFNFENVRDFLAQEGCKGPQRKVLREGVYAINFAQFVILTKSRTYSLNEADGEKAIQSMNDLIVSRQGFNPVIVDTLSDAIGVVTTHDGPSLPVGELIAPVVGQSDQGISLHNNFQDPDAFIQNKGFRGKQQQVLVDGTYYINRLFATVELIDKTIIKMGYAGVVISYS